MIYILYFTVLALLIIVITTIVMKKETFLPKGNHNCYPYSSSHQAYNSCKNLSKGWCTLGKYGPIPDYDEISAYDRSPLKCPDKYVRLDAMSSYLNPDKSWCERPIN